MYRNLFFYTLIYWHGYRKVIYTAFPQSNVRILLQNTLFSETWNKWISIVRFSLYLDASTALPISNCVWYIMDFCDCAREARYLLRNRKITRTMYNLNNTLRFRFYHEYVGILNFFYFLIFFLFFFIQFNFTRRISCWIKKNYLLLSVSTIQCYDICITRMYMYVRILRINMETLFN